MWTSERQKPRKRKRETERQRQRETETDRETERHRETQRETETQKERKRVQTYAQQGKGEQSCTIQSTLLTESENINKKSQKLEVEMR